MSTTTAKNTVGTTIHFVKPMTLHVSTRLGSEARNVAYGDEALLTAEVIAANRDRLGDCPLLRLLDDPESGVRRGPWPVGVSRIQPGSPQWDDARAAALQAAAQLPDPEDQGHAVIKVRETYGVASEKCSRTLTEYGPAR